ncbi:MAG: hypothetical protein KGL39_38350 [Patescibacteria group bacterium]|nr:hypothetical protein [Patescibacteria group bacterium]
MTPTWDQISGVLDRVLIALFSYLVAKGYIAGDQVAGYISLIIGILGAIWGFYNNRPKAILQSAAALPDVQKVVIGSQAMANSITSDKVDTK